MINDQRVHTIVHDGVEALLHQIVIETRIKAGRQPLDHPHFLLRPRAFGDQIFVMGCRVGGNPATFDLGFGGMVIRVRPDPGTIFIFESKVRQQHHL